MRIELPLKRHHKVDGMILNKRYEIDSEPSGKYSDVHIIENLDFFYASSPTVNQLDFGIDSILADFNPGSMACPLSVGFDSANTSIGLVIFAKTAPAEVGFCASAKSNFIQTAELDRFHVAFALNEASTAFLRKTTLNDFDSATLSEIGNRSLYDLSYIVVESDTCI